MDKIIQDLIKLREEYKSGKRLSFFLGKVKKYLENETWKELLRNEKERQDEIVERIEENLKALIQTKK